MIRTRMCLLALASCGGMLLLIATSQAQQPGASPTGGQPAPPPQPTSRPTIAVFNMATVMREYGKAKYQVYLLNEERRTLSVDLVDKRGKYVKITQEIQQAQDPKVKDQLLIQQRDLTRQIEDKDREIQKQLNEKSNVVIATLYDEIKTVVDKTAEMNGYHIVFAYPDASTAEEMKSPYVKELKLKPPAAQPFYVARHVDITGVVIQTLNTWYPAPAVPNQPAQNPPPAQGTTSGPPPGPTPGRP